jgi:hypothetical protein
MGNGVSTTYLQPPWENLRQSQKNIFNDFSDKIKQKCRPIPYFTNEELKNTSLPIEKVIYIFDGALPVRPIEYDPNKNFVINRIKATVKKNRDIIINIDVTVNNLPIDIKKFSAFSTYKYTTGRQNLDDKDISRKLYFDYYTAYNNILIYRTPRARAVGGAQ